MSMELGKTVRESKKQLVTVRDIEQHNGNGRDSERQEELLETVRDMQELNGTGETVRDSQQP